MEKSMSDPVEPDQKVVPSITFTFACGFALYWACFFTMLMRNSFMDGDIEDLWYHLFLRVVFLAGSALACAVIAHKADWMSQAKGTTLRRGGVFMFSAVAAVSASTSYSLGLTMPLAFDLVAWSLAGVGLACLLTLWAETLAGFPDRQKIVSIIASVALGTLAYLVMNVLSFPFNIGLLCVSPLASLVVLAVLAHDSGVATAAFVPRQESREHARFSASFRGIAVAYGIVFGLGIGSITQIEGSALLYTGIAFALAVGSIAAYFSLRVEPDSVRQTSSFRLLFPVLIIALIPMSFLQGMPAVACNLLLLACYIFFESVDIDVALGIARKRKASALDLLSTSQACLYGGMLVGHAIGLVATSSGVLNYAMLSAAALALVIVLAVFVTFASTGYLAGDSKRNDDAAGAFADGAHEPGRWKKSCERVAREAGLSARETEVFMLLAKGRGIEHIQNKLGISGHTVKTHVYNIYRKMEINSREELLDAVERRVQSEKNGDGADDAAGESAQG